METKLYVSDNSKKRVFPGGSSIDAEVVEISRPINWSPKSKSPKQKEVVRQEIIDVDVEEDCGDDGNVKFSDKGKGILVGNGSSGNSGPVDAVQPSDKDCLSSSKNPIILDDFGSDALYGADEDMVYIDDLYMTGLFDDYAVVQSHFDNMDIPTGIEAEIPWMFAPLEEQMVSTPTSTSGGDVSGAARDDQSTSFSTPPLVGKPTQFGSSSSSPVPALGKEGQLVIGSLNVKSSEGVSSSKILSSGAEKQLANWKKKFDATIFFDWNSPPKSFGEPSAHYEKKLGSSGATASNDSYNQSTHNGPYFPFSLVGSQVFDSSNLFHNQISPVSAGSPLASVSMNYFLQSSHNSATTAGNPSIPLASACNRERKPLGETLKNFRLFKKFDTVEDHSDHYYSRQASSGELASKSWAKKIQEEWKILENDLPDTIFVRVYESRMDLLRAVIMGADGTPYHDGLFFFDVFFPSNYPNVPPLVHYHSFGLRINPNLYNCGKVCLSLLNTWGGRGKEKWIPRESTMLQVLVSIQGLILNAKPYFNEPGYASLGGTKQGDERSMRYNENTYILNLKTMVFSMRQPPKHFEDFVLGHFFQSAQDVLVACEAYMDGAQVGSLVRGGVQDVDEGDKSCSPSFKASLAGFIKTVIDAFKQIDAKDCDKFLHLAQRGAGTGGVAAAPVVHANTVGYVNGLV